MDVIKRRNNFVRRWSLAALALVAVFAVVLTSGVTNRSRWNYLHHHGALQAIVSRIKEVQSDVGRIHLFSVDKSLDPSTLRPISGDIPDSDKLYEVSAVQFRKGEYVVEFLLDERGHFGRFGLLYSDAPLRIVTSGENRVIENAVFLPVLTGHASGNWWYATDLGE
jgi:hypothetical protein